jgi:hypothetical protein
VASYYVTAALAVYGRDGEAKEHLLQLAKILERRGAAWKALVKKVLWVLSFCTGQKDKTTRGQWERWLQQQSGSPVEWVIASLGENMEDEELQQMCLQRLVFISGLAEEGYRFVPGTSTEEKGKVIKRWEAWWEGLTEEERAKFY